MYEAAPRFSSRSVSACGACSTAFVQALPKLLLSVLLRAALCMNRKGKGTHYGLELQGNKQTTTLTGRRHLLKGLRGMSRDVGGTHNVRVIGACRSRTRKNMVGVLVDPKKNKMVRQSPFPVPH